MDWAAVGVGLVVGAALAALAASGLARARRRSGSGEAGSGATGAGDPAGANGADRPAAVAGQRGAGGDVSRRTLDSLRAGVVVLDPEDQLVVANPAARAMGLLRAGARAGTVAAHPMVRTLAGQVRRRGVRREVEVDLPRGGDADPLGVLLRAVELGAGLVAVEAADRTESHRVARVRRDFVANVGHELKTPIGALQLLAEALLDATGRHDGSAGTDPAQDVAAARRFAERIQRESARLGRLVTELLELSRLQGADPLPQPTPVSLDGVVAEAVDRVRTAAAARGIRLTVAGQQGLTGYGSDSQLATAVGNLADNAVGYSPEGGEVVITLRDEGEWLAVEVADRGIGIPPEDLDRVFERFYRSDRARSRATGGTGLGLAIVKHIATNHGGRVDVTSTPGAGSTFTLRLPARPLPVAGASPTGDGIGNGRAGAGGAGDGTPAPRARGGAGE